MTSSAPRTRVSAGIVLYRLRDGVVEVLLGHPGGPYFASKDAGHWSISDLLAVVPSQADGCGEGARLDDPSTTFPFPDPAASRARLATEVLAFLEATVGDRDAAWDALRRPSDDHVVRALAE